MFEFDVHDARARELQAEARQRALVSQARRARAQSHPGAAGLGAQVRRFVRTARAGR